MSRRLCLSLGMLTLAVVWLLPALGLFEGAFAAHMTIHMGVVAVAAPLVAFGIAGTTRDPVFWAPALFAPIPMSILELVVVWVWHAPALHHAAQHSSLLFAVEQASFLISGLLLWLSAFGGGAAERAQRGATGVIALLLTSMHMTLLGALLALPMRPLYGHGDHGAHALGDQHLGGAIMLAAGAISYLAGGLWLSAELLRQPRHARGTP